MELRAHNTTILPAKPVLMKSKECDDYVYENARAFSNDQNLEIAMMNTRWIR
jgi:hypothetical protein